MSLLLFLVFGFIVGLIARAIMPGEQRMGLVMTTVLGAAGALLGGFVSSLVSGRPVAELHASGFIGSILGALIVLFLVGGFFTRRNVV